MKAYVIDCDGFKWVYNCGWWIEGNEGHYRRSPFGHTHLLQPMGLLDFVESMEETYKSVTRTYNVIEHVRKTGALPECITKH